jgi:glycosyltransferase involved in cell wall biosynthesis
MTNSPNLVVRGVVHVANQGKGAAVKNGALYSKGKIILFTDADGATDINEVLSCLKRLESVKKGELALCIGDRNSEAEKV